MGCGEDIIVKLASKLYDFGVGLIIVYLEISVLSDNNLNPYFAVVKNRNISMLHSYSDLTCKKYGQATVYNFMNRSPPEQKSKAKQKTKQTKQSVLLMYCSIVFKTPSEHYTGYTLPQLSLRT